MSPNMRCASAGISPERGRYYSIGPVTSGCGPTILPLSGSTVLPAADRLHDSNLYALGLQAPVGRCPACLMGLVRKPLTFMNHLRWAWAIALGYAASILTHLWINAEFM